MKIEIRGTDYTPLSKFRLRIQGEEVPVNENSVEVKYIKRCIEYAFEKELIAEKSGDDQIRFKLLNLSSDKHETHEADDLYSWTSTNTKEPEIKGLIGSFSYEVAVNDYNEICNDLDLVDPFRGPGPYLVRVNILSRFDIHRSDNRNQEDRIDWNDRPFFLLHMLDSTSHSFLSELKSNDAPASLDDLWTWLLIILFRNKLLQLYRLGYYREYITRYENNDRPKGIIDITRHVKYNAGLRNGKIAYAYREKTVDNRLNHFILRANELLKQISPNLYNRSITNYPEFKRIMSELALEAPSFFGVSDSMLLNENSTPITSPYYQPYEDMREICVRIFRKKGISMMTTDNMESVDGFVVYLPDLFEIYAERILKEAFKDDKDIEVQSQYKINRPAIEESEIIKEIFPELYTERLIKPKEAVRPDYLIKHNNQIRLVMDAKCKPVYEGLEEDNLEKKLDEDRELEVKKQKYEPDRQKLVRDISFLQVKKFEDTNHVPPLQKGLLIYPKRTRIDDALEYNPVFGDKVLPTNPDWAEKSNNEWHYSISDKDQEKLSDEQKEKIKNVIKKLKALYERGFQGERKKELDRCFSIQGKQIGYLALPVAYIDEDDSFESWREKQNKAEQKCIIGIGNDPFIREELGER